MIARIVDRLVEALIAYAMRTPYFHLPDYMNRYWVLKPRWWTFGCSIRVHQILRSDDDRHLHDHPWAFMTVILRGGYTEVLEQAVVEYSQLNGLAPSRWRMVEWQVLPGPFLLRAFGRRCKPGSVIFHRARDAHRLIVPPGRHAWTLFFMGPRRQEWGFYTEEGKVPWNVYLPSEEATWQKREHAKHGVAE